MINRQLRFGKGKKGNFFTSTWSASLSSTEITRSETFWHVRSNVRNVALLKFLRLKFFWKELSEEEQYFAFSAPRFLDDTEFNVLLVLLVTTELGQKEIARRFELACKVLNRRSNFRPELIKQWESNILLTADRGERPIRPHKAFSGWIRNASSVGSKKKNTLSIPEPLSEVLFEDKFDEYKFLYELISVGRIETNLGIINLS